MNRLIVVLLLMILIPLSADAQVDILGSVQFDSTELLIGDQVHGRVILNANENETVVFPDLSVHWKDKRYEIVQLSDQIKKNAVGGKQVVTQNFVLSFWDTGYYQLPALPFSFTKNMKADTSWVEASPITVTFPQGITGDSTYMAPIKPILAEYKTFLDYVYAALPFVVVVIALLLLAFGIYWLIQWRRKLKANRRLLSPEEIALQEVKILEESDYLNNKNFAAFHAEVSLIIRRYLLNRFKIKTMELPSSEILPQVSFEHLEKGLIVDLKEVLETADLVKFAKASPLDQANSFAVDFIYRMVQYVQHRLEESDTTTSSY